MIHLANDPNASRTAYRPAAGESNVLRLDRKRSRDGHAWPFLSRLAGRPAPQNDPSKNPDSDSGS